MMKFLAVLIILIGVVLLLDRMNNACLGYAANKRQIS